MNSILFVLFILFIIAEAVSDQELWLTFKSYHGKQYKSVEDEKLRFDIFKDNIIKIERHNARYDEGKEHYYMGLNEFADLTAEEFLNKLSVQGFAKDKFLKDNFRNSDDDDLPAAVDWREKGIVTEVKNSGPCNPAWASSAAGSLEGQLALQTLKLVALSEQQLVDCSSPYGNNGCGDGFIDVAFQYVQDNGLATEEDYPSSDTVGECYDNEVQSAVQIRSYMYVNASEKDLKKAVATIGPLSAVVEANEYWQFYAGGILTSTCPGDELNLPVLVVGYDSAPADNSTLDYWIVKNFWGSNWGENGYIKIIRNRDNHCGISDYVLYPIL